jgi:hypothetical protein
MGHVRELRRTDCQGRSVRWNRQVGSRNAEHRKMDEPISHVRRCNRMGGCSREGDKGEVYERQQ